VNVRVRLLLLCFALLMPAVASAQQAETIEYYGTDAIGSIRIVWDPNGNVLGRQDYAPFGKALFPIPAMPKEGFVGNEQDAETDQGNFHARMFEARTGRFTRPDPIGGGLFAPQAWNRYAYALNRPEALTDASGLCVADFCDTNTPICQTFDCVPPGTGGGTGSGCNHPATLGSGDPCDGGDSGNGGGGDTTGGDTGGTTDGGDGQEPDPTPKQPKPPPAPNCPAGPPNVISFIHTNQAAANALQLQSNVPADYLLGLSGWESTWGADRFAAQGNNFFSLHGGSTAPFAIGSMKALGNNTYLSTFPSYLASGQSFLAQYGKGLAQASSPAAFALQLIKNHFNSGNAATGGNPNFLPNTVTGINMVIRRKGC
jgi:RHS repeat-associated protein